MEIWRPKEERGRQDKAEREKIETRMPVRLGKPLPLIPFVFHYASHAMPEVDKLPLGDVIAVNLDHYPERFAQQALGHNSQAVHHAYPSTGADPCDAGNLGE